MTAIINLELGRALIVKSIGQKNWLFQVGKSVLHGKHLALLLMRPLPTSYRLLEDILDLPPTEACLGSGRR